MNNHILSCLRMPWARVFAALGAGIFLIFTAPAQPTTNLVNGRYLLIFDTSSAMKKLVPATQNAVERLFFSMMDGQLRPGETIGVWTFSRKLRAGKFPLQYWLPQNAAMIASNITNFVRRQRYSSSTHFDAIMPDVNKLVQNSERLTVLIFCDGKEEIKGTPFDDGINGIFKRDQRALRKANQAFIVVLRSQFGRYVGYTVNSTIARVIYPEFPPLPSPPSPLPAAPAKTNSPPPQPSPPVAELPPLVIIGTNVSTNLISAAPPEVVSSNPPPPEVKSNLPPVETLASPTNTTPTNVALPKTAQTPTNAVAPPEENLSGLSRNGALAIGAVLLVAAAGLIIYALVRSRKTGRGSLITRSMKRK